MMIVAAIAGTLLALINILGVLMYDAREVKRLREYQQHPNARTYRQRPQVTVVVSAFNDTDNIMLTLDSIVGSAYKKVEILVVDLGSEDMTEAMVKGYIDLHPKQSIRLITRRGHESNRQVLNRAVKHYSSGELIMAIPAGGTLKSTTLHDAVRHFAVNDQLEVLNTNKRLASEGSVIGLFERYHTWLLRRSDKALSALGFMMVINRMAMYRRGAYLCDRSRTLLNIRYAHDVLVTVPAFASYRRLVRRRFGAYVATLRGVGRSSRPWLHVGYICCSAIVSIAGPLLIGYFLYLAFYLHESMLLQLSLAGLTAYLLIAIGEEGSLNPWQKALYVLGVPVTFCLFYLLSLGRLLAVMAAPIYRWTKV